MSELESEKNVEYEMHLKKVKEEVLKRLAEYQKTISYMSCDAPISILLLPKSMESILSRNGCLRVYDLIDRDFTKIEGLGEAAIGNLTSRLNQFLSML